MFKKFFNKENKENANNKDVLIASLLIHAAKIDDNYTNFEKEIIKKALMGLYKIKTNEAVKLLELAEKKEQLSNQIIEFTREIKNFLRSLLLRAKPFGFVVFPILFIRIKFIFLFKFFLSFFIK